MFAVACVGLGPDTLGTARNHLVSGRYTEAIEAYRAILREAPATPAAHEGLVRALLASDNAPEALKTIDEAQRFIPNTAEGHTLASIAERRRTEFEKAETYLGQALKLKPGHPFALAQMAELFKLLSRFNTAQRYLLAAHKAAPDDPAFLVAYANEVRTNDEHTALLKLALRLYDSRTEAAKRLQEHVEADQIVGDRWITSLLSDYKPYRVKLVPTQSSVPTHYTVRVRVNDRELTMLLDTGASGILIDRRSVKKAGLEKLPYASRERSGVGDGKSGKVDQFFAKELSIGELRFANVLLDVTEGVRDAGADGVVGSDFFEQFLITLDFPKSQLRLDPYPGLQSAPPTAVWVDAQAEPPAGFHPFVRWNHYILIPASINGRKRRFMIVDSGANNTILDSTASKEDASVEYDASKRVRGLNGQVDKVYRANNVRIAFASIVQNNEHLPAIDMSRYSDQSGVSIGGLIGNAVLSQVRMTINYREGCVRFER